MTRLREHYDNVVKPELIKQFGYANPMQVPKLEKVVINMGVGEASQDRKLIKGAVEEMTLISAFICFNINGCTHVFGGCASWPCR